jgi:hypothetical protein
MARVKTLKRKLFTGWDDSNNNGERIPEGIAAAAISENPEDLEMVKTDNVKKYEWLIDWLEEDGTRFLYTTVDSPEIRSRDYFLPLVAPMILKPWLGTYLRHVDKGFRQDKRLKVRELQLHFDGLLEEPLPEMLQGDFANQASSIPLPRAYKKRGAKKKSGEMPYIVRMADTLANAIYQVKSENLGYLEEFLDDDEIENLTGLLETKGTFFPVNLQDLKQREERILKVLHDRREQDRYQ